MLFTTTPRWTGLAIASLVLLTAPRAFAETAPSVPTQQIDGVTFPASFPAGVLKAIKDPTAASAPQAAQGSTAKRRAPRNTTNITTDLYVPGKIQGENGEPPLAHCRNLAGGGRQCVTPAPAGGWPTGQVNLGVNMNR